jgi:hypothetical protein
MTTVPMNGDPATSAEGYSAIPSEDQPRSADRTNISAEVRLRRSGTHGYCVNVFDASRLGCKIEFAVRPSIGERVWVKFDGIEAIEAVVRWVDDYIGGLEFQHPIHPAVFKELNRKADGPSRAIASR